MTLKEIQTTLHTSSFVTTVIAFDRSNSVRMFTNRNTRRIVEKDTSLAGTACHVAIMADRSVGEDAMRL